MISTKPAVFKEYDEEKLSEISKNMSACFAEAAEFFLPTVEAALKAITEFVRALPPEVYGGLIQLEEREDRKERSRKKYERMMARRKPKRVKSRKRW